MVRYGDEDEMKAAVYVTPVMAVIDASQKSFQTYVSGIYSDVFCSSTRLDHAIQVVGYGSEKGQDYWICKNSWGKHLHCSYHCCVRIIKKSCKRFTSPF